jgi:hypothetical protein
MTTNKKSSYGIDGYNLPTNDKLITKPRGFTTCKGTIPNFIDVELKKKKHVPSPGTYDAPVEWEALKNKTNGQFKKSPR